MSLQNQLGAILFSALRPYQIDALDKINDYINSDSIKQALIKMPMGTGKSIVIAVVSTLLTNVESSIIVTSSTAVKDQLINDISEKAWEKMGVTDWPRKRVVEVLPSTFSEVSDSPTIFVSTIQALLLLKKNKPDKFELLLNKLDLVLFDEGHKEPANEWQTVIRSFRKKVILFTATPVRNDENKFLIDSRYVFTYSFQQAQTDSYIRNVEFELFQCEENIDPVVSFANKVFTRYQQYIEHYGCNINEVKVLIRCGGYEDIKSMVDALKDRISVVGIHERFTNKREDNCLTNQVPEDIRTSDIVFWVHQFKLIEGIDNYQFSLLGIYETLPDPRALVQQIGRIIRQGEHLKEAIVMLWEDEIHQKEWWQSYLEYERLTYLNPMEMLFKYEEYYVSVKEAHPSTVYLDKKYLKRFSITENEEVEGKLKKYQIPRKANIYETTRNNDNTEMNVNVLIQKIKDEFNETDVLVLDDFYDQNRLLGGIVYSKYENSTILVNESFLEIKIGIIFFRILGNKLYLYDSNNFVPSPIKIYWKRVAASQLKKLFYEDSQFSSMTIQNGSITFNSFNRMIVSSKDVSKMVPDVTDKFNLCGPLSIDWTHRIEKITQLV